MAIFTWLLALTLRATAVLVAALALESALRRSRAHTRHRLLTVAAVALLMLPVLPRVLPSWPLPILPAWMETAPRAASPGTTMPALDHSPTPSVPAPATSGRESGSRAAVDVDSSGPGFPLPSAVPVSTTPGATDAGANTLSRAVGSIWLIGCVASLLALLRGLHRESRLRRSSRPAGREWTEALRTAVVPLTLRRGVRLLESDEVDTPLSAGLLRPVVLVPGSATTWPPDRRLVVLQHELVHAMGADPLRHLAWRLVGALYWFHPLVGLATRRASIAGEEACDEAVLEMGHRPSSYARHLMEIAEGRRGGPGAFVHALPMVDRHQLERRLLVILDSRRSSRPSRLLAGLALASFAALVLGVSVAVPLAAARSESPAKARLAETRPLVAKAASAAVAAVPPAMATAPPVAAVPGTPATLADVEAVDGEAALPAFAAADREAARGDDGDSPCFGDLRGNFTGVSNDGPFGSELNGYHNGDFTLRQRIGGGTQLCARVRGPVKFDEKTGAILEMGRGARVVVETRVGVRSQRMSIAEQDGPPRYTWLREGMPSAMDDVARAWLGEALAAVSAFRQIGDIQGQVGSLQGEIGSIQGEVGSLQGKIGSIQGQEGSLQGRIGSIQGELGSLQGKIGSHQGAIGSLQGSRWQADAGELERIDRRIREHEVAIKSVEANIAALNFPERLAKAEAELAAFDKEGERRIAELARRITGVRAEERIRALQRQIDDLHADQRIREIEGRLRPALERLKRAMDGC